MDIDVCYSIGLYILLVKNFIDLIMLIVNTLVIKYINI